MGSSAKKKREKKQTFQKAKLKVGKGKPLPDNHTSTAFQTRKIVLSTQSLSISAPTLQSSFAHHLSLLTSTSPSHRRDSLSHLIHLLRQLSGRPPTTSISTRLLLSRVLPNLSSPSRSVRANTLTLLRAVDPVLVAPHLQTIFLALRSAATNLVADIRMDALRGVDWLLQGFAGELVAARGGWVRGLRMLCAVLGWEVVKDGVRTGGNGKGWSKPSKAGSKEDLVALQVMGRFLEKGLGKEEREEEVEEPGTDVWPVTYGSWVRVPQRVDPFRRLGLFETGAIGPEDMAFEVSEERWDIFVEEGFMDAVKRGIEKGRKEGGDVGRAAGIVYKILHDTDKSRGGSE
ncbi:MAG: rRNA processing protein [Vezdaea aestivalis]|nr:MAG: rRNA processing protein [Vezdaea aestivalis]